MVSSPILIPDHFLRLEVIKFVFPDARVVAYKKITKQVDDADGFKIDHWGNMVLKENGASIRLDIGEIQDDKLYLEGE